jgi:hypothetical protein
MNKVLQFDMRLKELEERATDRLLMAEVFDEKAFGELYSHICLMAEELKSEYLVSKQFLASVLKASGAIRSRAEYLPDVKRHMKWANDFDFVLDLVAIGEAPSDRKPGVPRII